MIKLNHLENEHNLFSLSALLQTVIFGKIQKLKLFQFVNIFSSIRQISNTSKSV